MDTPKGAMTIARKTIARNTIARNTIARTTMVRQQMPDYNGHTIDVRQ